MSLYQRLLTLLDPPGQHAEHVAPGSGHVV
jgi:hypothetical protein